MQAVQGLLDTLLPVPSVQRFNAVLQCIQVQAVRAAEVKITCLNGVGQAQAGGFKHAGSRVKYGFLGDISHTQTVLCVQGAIVGLVDACQDFQQGRFARAVAADQAHALLHFERKIGVVQEGHMAKGQLCVL